MKVTWVVVADGARGRLLSVSGKQGPMRERADLVHGETRPHGTLRETDRAGRTFDRSGTGRHAMEPRHDPADIEAEAFAREISERLVAGAREREFDRLVLVAPPRFLGRLREALPEAVARCVEATVDKDYTRLGVDQLTAKLAASF